MIEARGLQPRRFCARKGRALIWTANLLHGGDRVVDMTRSRWSQVTHYFFAGCCCYTPSDSDPFCGRITFRNHIDIATSEPMPNILSGCPVPQEFINSASTGRASARAEISDDFDPEGYLRLNPDVAASGFGAKQHSRARLSRKPTLALKKLPSRNGARVAKLPFSLRSASVICGARPRRAFQVSAAISRVCIIQGCPNMGLIRGRNPVYGLLMTEKSSGGRLLPYNVTANHRSWLLLAVARALLAVRSILRTPDRQVISLILVSLLLRIVFAGLLGLGIDESYMVAAGRTLALSYFDHPPASWWIVWITTHLLHSETELAVRLPFILLFALTTWLMYRVTSRAYTPQAGVWCAVAMNLSPVFGVTTGSWVLPDGPLVAALAGALLWFLQALETDRRHAWVAWTATGLCAGMAMLSKYSAIMPIVGATGYLLTSPRHRSWLRRPEPYIASLLVFLIFSPVVLWNMQHHWASFVFQGGRAVGRKFRPFAPLAVLGGEMVYLLPWIGVPLLVCLVRGFYRGPEEWRGWLFVCLALPAILFFPLVALWSDEHVLFHWAVPGFLMLFPVLGFEVARIRYSNRRLVSHVAVGTAAVLVLAAAFAGSEVRWNWLPETGEDFAFGHDPDIQAVDWISLRSEIAQVARQHSHLVVAATRWYDCGKLAYALGRSVPFLCLAKDARQFGDVERPKAYLGYDILLVAPGRSLTFTMDEFGSEFNGIEQLPPVALLHAGRPALEISLFLGHAFRGRSSL